MEPLAIVGYLEEVSDVVTDVADGTPGLAVDLLVLERLHEAFGLCIVVWVTDATHAGGDGVGLEHGSIVGTGILDAAIGVMDETAGRWLSLGNCHGEGFERGARPSDALRAPNRRSC